MARPSYEDVWTFSRSVQHVSQEARKAFQAGVQEIRFSDWAVASAQLKELVEAVMDMYGAAASELGAQWYEFCRANEFKRGYTAIVGEVSRYSVRSDVRAAIDKLFGGEVTEGELLAMMSGIVVDQTQKAAREAILLNLDEDLRQAKAALQSSGGSMRADAQRFIDRCGYARVPTADACAFCVLLASQGFVYRSEYSAKYDKYGAEYHEHCNCVAVPFSRASEIPGYGDKLSEYEQKYRDADNLRRSGDLPDALKDRIAQARKEHEASYAAGLTNKRWDSTLNENTIIMRWQNPGMH